MELQRECTDNNTATRTQREKTSAYAEVTSVQNGCLSDEPTTLGKCCLLSLGPVQLGILVKCFPFYRASCSAVLVILFSPMCSDWVYIKGMLGQNVYFYENNSRFCRIDS